MWLNNATFEETKRHKFAKWKNDDNEKKNERRDGGPLTKMSLRYFKTKNMLLQAIIINYNYSIHT